MEPVTEVTVAEAAAERGVTPARIRQLIAAHGITPTGVRRSEGGRAYAPLYPADKIRSIPGPSQGQRNDLIGQRIGELLAAARVVAEWRGTRDEYDRLHSEILTGSPHVVRTLLARVRRWARRRARPAEVDAAVARVEELGGLLGDLPEWLPLTVRARVLTAEAQARLAAGRRAGG